MRILHLVAVHDAEEGDALGDAKPGEDIGDPRVFGKLKGDTVAIGVGREVLSEVGKEPEPDLQRKLLWPPSSRVTVRAMATRSRSPGKILACSDS